MGYLHPAYRLFCWLLVVIAIQCLSGIGLAAALAGVMLLGRGVVGHFYRLARRARWLIASLIAVLAWGVAGEPVWAGGGGLVPTFEGLAEGAVQAGRLLLVLAAVAALLETTPVDRLMAGCHALLSPLRALGIDVERAVVRLSLALHYADRLPAGAWKRLLATVSLLAPAGPQSVLLALPPVRWQDRATALAAVSLTLLVCLA